MFGSIRGMWRLCGARRKEGRSRSVGYKTGAEQPKYTVVFTLNTALRLAGRSLATSRVPRRDRPSSVRKFRDAVNVKVRKKITKAAIILKIQTYITKYLVHQRETPHNNRGDILPLHCKPHYFTLDSSILGSEQLPPPCLRFLIHLMAPSSRMICTVFRILRPT